MFITKLRQPHKSYRILAWAMHGFLLWILPMLSANANNNTTTKTAGNRASMMVSMHEVELKFHDVRLSDAMADVSRRSKVKILVSPDLQNEKLNTQIKSADWTNAIKSLLAEFNNIAIVDRRGDFRKIWITGRKDPAIVSANVAPGITGHASQVDSQSEPSESIGLPIAIWQSLEYEAESSDDDSIPSAPIQMDPLFFESLQIGQPIEIPIPQEEFPLFGVVSETHSQLNGDVQVWSGPIDGSHETASFTVTRGEVTTYVTVATGTSIYEVTLNNTTGIGNVVNETDLTKDVTEQDYVIPKEAGQSSNP